MRTIDANELDDLMTREGVMIVGMTTDVRFYIPDEKWFFGEFADGLGKFLTALKTNDYIPEVNDCDNFGQAGSFFANTLHTRQQRRSQLNPPGGIAIGEFWYSPEWSETEHSIVVAVIRKSDKFELRFM